MTPAVTIENLSHRYAGRTALQGLSLSVEGGEIFGLLGPNGSGKTTLFRILSTLIAPQDGTVSLQLPGLEPMDIVLARDNVRRHIGVVFQHPAIDKQLTAEENLVHHGHLFGLRGGELAGRINDLLKRFDLHERRRELAGALSGGMRRRVELAKALLTRPRLLIMDEPSTGLDPSARLEMWRYLQQVRTSDGVTVLLTTHLMEEADRCDRLAILDGGRMVAQGSPEQLKQRIGGEVITLTSRQPSLLTETLNIRLGLAADALDGVIRIQRPRAHELVPQLVEAAPGLIDSLSIHKPTLEDVFIDATGRRFDDLGF